MAPAPNPVITIPWLSGTSNTITLDIMGTNGTSNFTGLSSPNATISSTQDGYPAGTLQSMTVDQDGIISGTFTNGQILNLAQLSLSSFTNTNGLQQSGNNHWSQTLASGAPTMTSIQVMMLIAGRSYRAISSRASSLSLCSEMYLASRGARYKVRRRS